MNYAGKFWLPSADAFFRRQFGHLTPGRCISFIVSDSHLLFSGNYERHGRDLIITDQSQHLIVPNYFSGSKRPLLRSSDGVSVGRCGR